MNSIAAQIDYTTDVLRATNDLLEARAAHRSAQASGNIHQVIAAYVKVIHAERALRELYPADDITEAVNVDPLPDCGETKDDHPDYYGRRELMTADERADDPRRGQVPL